MNSTIRSRAGLVALVFALIISFVSAVPIRASTGSGLSSTFKLSSRAILNGQDHIRVQLDTGVSFEKISLSGRMSTLPAATKALTRREDISTDMDDQLVRRNIFDKIKHAFQSFGRKIKEGFQKFGGLVKKGFQKAGSAIKHGFQKFGGLVKSGFQKAGSAIKHGFQKFGGLVKTGFQKAGSAIKHGFQKFGGLVKTGFQKAGAVLKKGFQKVGHWIKTTGAKIAKFGLKVYQSVTAVVSKVVGFIPVIGKPLGRAIAGVSKVAGVISDRIHVKLSDKLEKGMDVMNKANTVMGFIPRRRDLLEEEAFQQRDISEAYFEARDDNALENREESYLDAYERDILDGDNQY